MNGDVSIPGSHSVLPTATPLPLASLQHPQHHVPMTHRGQLYPLENDYQVDGGYNPYPRSSHHQQQLMAASPQPPSMRRGVDRMTVMPSPQHQYAPPPNLVQQHPGGYATSNYTNYPNAHENVSETLWCANGEGPPNGCVLIAMCFLASPHLH